MGNMKRTGLLAGLFVVAMSAVTVFAGEWKYYAPLQGIEDAVYREGELWCATGRGLFILDTEDFSYRRITHAEGFPVWSALELVWESEETLIVSAFAQGDVPVGAGVFRYNVETDAWDQLVIDSAGEYGEQYIDEIICDREGNVWCISMDGFLYKVVDDRLVLPSSETGLPDNFHSISLGIAPDGAALLNYRTWTESETISVIARFENGAWKDQETLENDVYTVGENNAVTSNGTIWRTTNSSIRRTEDGVEEDMTAGFTAAIEEAIAPQAFSRIEGVYSADDKIWVEAYCGERYTHYDVLGTFANDEWVFYVPEPDLIYPYSTGGANNITVDSVGTVWMTGFGQFSAWPVVSFDTKNWTKYPDLRLGYDIISDSENRIWMFGGKEISYFDNGDLIGLPDPGVWLRTGAATSTAVWGGDQGGNVLCYDYTGWATFPASVTGTGWVTSIAADDQYGVWVTGQNVVAHYDGSDWTLYDESNSTLRWDWYVNDVAIGIDGIAWFATDTGLCCFDGESWGIFTTGNSLLPSDDVRNVMCSQRGDLWIGTRGGGMCRYDGENWELFPPGDYPENVGEIAEAPDGSIWMLTSFGLMHYTPDNLPTLVETGSEPRPAAIAITGAWPNPFNSVVNIGYELTEAMPVEFEVYNLAGQRIYHHDLGRITAGIHQIMWDGITDDSGLAATGLYILRLDASVSSTTVKVMYLK